MENIKTRSLTRVSIFTALIAVGAFISIPLRPVPITLQTFFVLLAGYLLTPSEAFFAPLAYMALGLIGIPIFAGFTGGLQSIFSPSFGFIIAFSLQAYLVSRLKKDTDSTFKLIGYGLLSTLLVYGIGLTYMVFILSKTGSLPAEVMPFLMSVTLPFLPGDIIKIILAVLVYQKLPSHLIL